MKQLSAKLPYQKLPFVNFIERFLYRLMNSKYGKNFVIRGSSLLYIYNSSNARSTKDIDFMAINISNELKNIEKIIKDVCKINCPYDCVTFLPETVKLSKIQSNKLYNGVRVQITATLEQMKEPISFDIGYDDIITPNAITKEYPTLLKEMPSFYIKMYNIETALAEKIQTIISRKNENTRMKDFYDIWFIMNNIYYDTNILHMALYNTFSHRNTLIDTESPVFDISFYIDKTRNILWDKFIKKSQIKYISLYDVGLYIINNVKPLLEKIQ